MTGLLVKSGVLYSPGPSFTVVKVIEV